MAGFSLCYIFVFYCLQRHNDTLDKLEQKYQTMVNILTNWQKKI